MLTAIKHIEDDKWLYKCDCGNEIIASRNDVSTGRRKSCGCMFHKSRPRKNIAGQRFGRLSVIDYKDGEWRCKCDCGKETHRSYRQLIRPKVASCGCYLPLLEKNTTHGGYGTPTYKCWAEMKSRCYNSKNRSFPRYGGRGIKVCDRWLNSFENFIADMGERPSKEYSLDRIDVNGDYCPENCRWATILQQANNKRNNIMIEHGGECHSINDWCRILGGINARTARSRYYNGLSFEKIFHKGNLVNPYRKRRRILTDDEVRFIRNYVGKLPDCKSAFVIKYGKEFKDSMYYDIRAKKAYADVI